MIEAVESFGNIKEYDIDWMAIVKIVIQIIDYGNKVRDGTSAFDKTMLRGVYYGTNCLVYFVC